MQILFCLLAFLFSGQVQAYEANTVSLKTFQGWKKEKQKQYTQELRESLYKFELNQALDSDFEIATDRVQRWLDSLAIVNEAVAAQETCLIGGVERPMVRKKGRWVCPAFGRTCGSFEGGDTGFRCGRIWGEACVSRNPLRTLSQRCHESAKPIDSADTFNQVRPMVESVAANCKKRSSRYRRGCKEFQSQLAALETKYPEAATASPPAAAEKPSAPEVPAPQPKPPEEATPPPTPKPPEPQPVTSPPAPPAPMPKPESGASPPPAPSAAHAKEDEGCKASYGLVVEGHDTSVGRVDANFHQEAKSIAEAYANTTSDGVMVIRPPGDLHEVFENLDFEVAAVKEAFKNAPHGKSICDSNAPAQMAQFALGAKMGPRKVSEDLTSYSSNPKVQSTDLDPNNPNALANSKLFQQVKKLKAKCGDKAKQVVMISLIDHGSDRPCEIALTDGSRMSPEDVAEKLIKPLADQGAKVVFTADACFSGCFVNALTKKDFKAPVCVMSETRASSVGYGADKIIRGTYDDVYPVYLSKLKNPMKAHICASIWDPLNEPQIGATGVKKEPVTRSLGDQRLSSLTALGQKLGLGDSLVKDCKRVAGHEGFGTLSEEQIKEVFACPAFHDALQSALVSFGKDAADKFLDTVQDPNKAPGLDAVLKMASSSVAETQRGCDINLSDYQSKNEKPAIGHEDFDPTPSKAVKEEP